MAQYCQRAYAPKTLASLPVFLLVSALSLPAVAEQDIAQQPAPPEMQRYLEEAYAQVHKDATALEQVALKQCQAASEGGKTAATAEQKIQAAFEQLAQSWSSVAFIRIGPYRDNHAGQRMQFWPDKRGSGERQIQQALMSQPSALLEADSLQQQSVALQGLPAFEAVMMQLGEGVETSDEKTATFLCDYLGTLAGGMTATTGELAEAMTVGSDALKTLTFAQWMEVIRGGLQISGDMKLVAIGQSMRSQLASLNSAQTTTPLQLTRKVPFSRSHLALPSVAAEIDGVGQLLDSAGIEDLLADTNAGYVSSIRFQLRQAEQAVERLSDLEGRKVSATELEDAVDVVDYAAGMLAQSGRDMMNTLYPALGLSRGFNSMDGD